MSLVPSAEAALGQTARIAAADEAVFVAELQAGSEEAFCYLLGVYQNPVFNLILHIVENPADAPDVLQDVFVKIFRKVNQFQGESSLKTWIYRIAVHEASNHRRGWLRRLRWEPVSLDDELVKTPVARSTYDTPYELFEKGERQLLVRRALGSLAPPYRAVVVLREIEEMSYEEIAQVLGVAEGTVKSRLQRGRDLLRRKLAGYAARPEEF
jgi:RNA polymerase sigma-70 factor (ECF subfamily)